MQPGFFIQRMSDFLQINWFCFFTGSKYAICLPTKIRTEIKYNFITINFHATVPLTKEPVRVNAVIMCQLISRWLLTAGRIFFKRSEYLEMMLLKAEGLEKAAARLSVHTGISASKDVRYRFSPL
jgi:hypothetical protein